MECKDYKEQFISLMTDTLNQAERSRIESHIEVCADCRKEFDAEKKVWELMGEIVQPEPSEAMHAGFNILLNNYKEEFATNKKPVADWLFKLREYWSIQLQPRMAFNIVLIAVGLISGYFLHQPQQSAESFNKQIDSLSSQVSEMKQVLMLSLIGDASASQRIRAVAYTDEMTNVDLKIIGALFTTLNEDPNVNVRLATLEALVKLAGEPKVREGLVKSIELQESPLMQSAIADVMVLLQEKSSVQPLQKLMNKKGLNLMVKNNIEKSIQQLI
ncbi:MAG: HEAT repeat domain-containing protein [Bacteroidetes bacterium]|nr:HEAT repeat domain-containing protein [Bacteroidota bacterium]